MVDVVVLGLGDSSGCVHSELCRHDVFQHRLCLVDADLSCRQPGPRDGDRWAKTDAELLFLAAYRALGHEVLFGRVGCQSTNASCPMRVEVPVLPEPMYDAIADDASGALAQNYRRWVKQNILPRIIQISQILKEHSVICELPNKEFLATTFPDDMWYVLPTDAYLIAWRNAASEWQLLTNQWDEGDFANYMPRGVGGFLPVFGLRATMEWSRDQGKAKQLELIAMTTADEEDVSGTWETLAKGGS